jgi:hypothetical protein
MLHWLKFRKKLSAYRDHSLRAEEFRSVWSHLYHCAECREELGAYEGLGQTLRDLPAPAIPKELLPILRIRLSQERARNERPSLIWRVRNQWGHLALPGAAGILSAVLLFGMFGSHFGLPLRTTAEDVPLVVRTPARLRAGAPLELGSNMGDLVVQILVDPQGRVADYDIVAGTYTAQEARNLRNNLLFAVFDPAMVFGVPTSDTLVLSYKTLQIHG